MWHVTKIISSGLGVDQLTSGSPQAPVQIYHRSITLKPLMVYQCEWGWIPVSFL